MAMSGGRDDGEPMMEMNTTPLIDVMLVLLIMFILSLPRPTHAVKIDLPPNTPTPPPPVDPVKNRVAVLTDGTVTWNGAPVDLVRLRQYLDQSVQMVPEPELQFQPDSEARYEKVDETLAVIKQARVTKLGFVGNEAYYNKF